MTNILQFSCKNKTKKGNAHVAKWSSICVCMIFCLHLSTTVMKYFHIVPPTSPLSACSFFIVSSLTGHSAVSQQLATPADIIV